ncbi:MAG: hypothetical protein ACI8Z1_002750, partial [Candidatus Azotimanducaceae bacterium]
HLPLLPGTNFPRSGRINRVPPKVAREDYRLIFGGFRAIYIIGKTQLLILALDAGRGKGNYK